MLQWSTNITSATKSNKVLNQKAVGCFCQYRGVTRWWTVVGGWWYVWIAGIVHSWDCHNSSGCVIPRSFAPGQGSFLGLISAGSE